MTFMDDYLAVKRREAQELYAIPDHPVYPTIKPVPELYGKVDWTKDTTIVSPGGLKYDSEKPRYDLLPPDALADLVSVYTYGAAKYAGWNWAKGIAWSRVFAGIMRHLWAWYSKEDLDPESGLPHLAHAAWGCFTLLSYSRHHLALDDRPNLGGDY